MPTHTESIATLNTGMESLEKRMTAMEENCITDVQQMMAAIERIAKAVEVLQPKHRVGKQPAVPQTEPLPQTPRPLSTPRLEVPIFNGEGATGWLYQLNRYFAINNTPPDQMLDVAPMFMSVDALLLYQWKETTGQISTWSKLAQDIKRRFGSCEYYDVEVAINQLV
ncbi:unnamed protein product [Rhodiola kirilowii]